MDGLTPFPPSANPARTYEAASDDPLAVSGFEDEALAFDPLDDDVDADAVREATAQALSAALDWNEVQDAERKGNLDRYLGRPYGTEMEGFSQVVDRTVYETIGWILPALLEIFHGSDETGQFEPGEAAEVDGAEQATDLVNFVYLRDNPGFLASAAVLLDALIERIGVWKAWWGEEASVSVTRHEGLLRAELEQLLSEPGVDLLSLAESVDPQLSVPLYRCRIRRTRRKGRVMVEPVPPEEYGYNPDARSCASATFHYHRRGVARADLKVMGFDHDLVDSLAADDVALEGRSRRWDAVEGWVVNGAHTHESMQLVLVSECYIRADFDGDGVAEWRQVWLAGPGDELLGQEIVDAPPFVAVSPVLLSHRVEGLSIADAMKDLQAIRTDIVRQMLDGLFEANSPRQKVKLSAAKQTWEAVLNPAPSKPIPVRDIDDVTWDSAAWNGGQALPFLEFLDRAGERRSGVSGTSSGTNPDLLQGQTAAGLNQLMSAAQQRVGLIARIMAETGYKPLFRRILRLLVQHQDKARAIRLRGTFVQMDPASWNADMDYVPNVGLGTGDKSRVRQALGEMLTIQKEAITAGAPLATWKHMYNTLKEYVKATGLSSVEPYFSDPEQTPLPQPAPPPDPMADPMVMASATVERIKADVAMAKARMDDDFRRDKLEADVALEIAKMQHRQNIDLAGLPARWDAPRPDPSTHPHPEPPQQVEP